MAIETEGGTYINVNGNEEKGHVNIYDSDPRGEHNSIHININYDEETFTITEKEDDKKTSEKHKCFLTTACMKHQLKYFDDNCYELTTLRWFRNKFVTKSDIQYYYQIAPIIVNVLNNVSNSDEMYKQIYESVINMCIIEIENGNYNRAYEIYKNAILELEEITKKELGTNLVKVLKQIN